MTTIPGDLSHLQSAHRPYALLANAKRVDWIRQERWINYTRAEQVLVRLGELLQLSSAASDAGVAAFWGNRYGQDSHHSTISARKRLPL